MYHPLETLGYLSALLIGLSLGLMGGGGSILTVPILVYLFGISPVIATSYSLFIVGITSLIGSIHSIQKEAIDFRMSLLFGLPSVLSILIIRNKILPVVPATIQIGNNAIAFGTVTMILFALVMIFSSFFMLRGRERLETKPKKKFSMLLVIFYGIGVGLLTGFLGAGGGFLLIPALVILLGMDMKKAIGSSLFMISFNSLIGFVGDFGHYEIDWHLLVFLTIIGGSGVHIGGLLNKRIEGGVLRKVFGFLVLLMGIFIFFKECF